MKRRAGLVAALLCGSLGSCSSDPEEGAAEDLGTDRGTDAPSFDTDIDLDDGSTTDTSAGSDLGAVPLPSVRCTSDDLPRIVSVAVLPSTLNLAADGQAAVELRVACFTGPIVDVEVSAGEPATFASIDGLADNEGTVTATVADLVAWLGSLAPGAYPITVTASSETETLTEAGLATITIEE